MASNSFGNIFKITTWGESHGKAIGVVIDGCPAGLELSEKDVNHALAFRQPGKSPYTSPRKEPDIAQIYSGVFEGKTTGTPISIIIMNQDADPTKYISTKELLRPGHANFTYLEKYGIFDYLGGGRASARETACRVAAGAVAKKLLSHFQIELIGYVKEIGGICAHILDEIDLEALKTAREKSAIFCPDPSAEKQIVDALKKNMDAGDSLGGVIECMAFSLPIGLGDPLYEKLEANLAKAMLSLPATKGFEIGSGFQSAKMQGSEHNDLFTNKEGTVVTKTNFAGGVLGGISTGMPLIIRVAFKPTSSIKKSQQTLTLSKEAATFQLPEGSRHDPCVAIRAVPIVEAMCALVLVDSLLLMRCNRL